MENYKLDARAGDNFTRVAEKAKQIATEQNVIVEFDFNGVKCLVDKNTNLDWLYRDYSNSWTMEWKTIGTNCVEKYSKEVEADFKRRRRIIEEKQAEQNAIHVAKERKERKVFELNTQGVKLELSDVDGWNKSRKVNSDGYGSAALDFAEGWAKLMQIEINRGKTIAQCYDHTQKGLGFLGITGFQFGAAVSVLSQVWKYGDDLRKVHNKKYGISEDVKGAVSPEILTIN